MDMGTDINFMSDSIKAHMHLYSSFSNNVTRRATSHLFLGHFQKHERAYLEG